jgi:hypothetical protein
MTDRGPLVILRQRFHAVDDTVLVGASFPGESLGIRRNQNELPGCWLTPQG